MNKREKNKILRKVDKAQSNYIKAESDISSLTQFIQPYFDKEVAVCPSSDGPIITDDDGEIGFVKTFIENLK